MIEFVISKPLAPDTMVFGIRWRKRDGLLYHSAITIDCTAGPEAIVQALRTLADKVEKEIQA